MKNHCRCSIIWITASAHSLTGTEDSNFYCKPEPEKLSKYQGFPPVSLFRLLKDSFRDEEGLMPFRITGPLFLKALKKLFVFLNLEIKESALKEYFSILKKTTMDAEVLNFAEGLEDLSNELLNEENNREEITELNWLGLISLSFTVDFLKKTPEVYKKFGSHMESLFRYLKIFHRYEEGLALPSVSSAKFYQKKMLEFLKFLDFKVNGSLLKDYSLQPQNQTFNFEEEIERINNIPVKIYEDHLEVLGGRRGEDADTEWLSSNAVNSLLNILVKNARIRDKVSDELTGHNSSFSPKHCR